MLCISWSKLEGMIPRHGSNFLMNAVTVSTRRALFEACLNSCEEGDRNPSFDEAEVPVSACGVSIGPASSSEPVICGLGGPTVAIIVTDGGSATSDIIRGCFEIATSQRS